MLVGLIWPDRGEITVNGVEPARFTVEDRWKIGYVSEKQIGPDQDTWKFGHRGIRRSVTIDGFDAEATKKELTTHLEVFRWYCPTADRTGMLVLRSPRPFKNDDAVWRVLLSFWEKIECHATDQ